MVQATSCYRYVVACFVHTLGLCFAHAIQVSGLCLPRAWLLRVRRIPTTTHDHGSRQQHSTAQQSYQRILDKPIQHSTLPTCNCCCLQPCCIVLEQFVSCVLICCGQLLLDGQQHLPGKLVRLSKSLVWQQRQRKGTQHDFC